jgi:rhodanese-related sulfurtransferase
MAMGALLACAGDNFPNISAADLKQAISEKKVVLLDVNGTSSWRKGHIPGALDYQVVADGLSTRLPTDKTALVVAYCGNESCPAYRAGAAAAVKLGYTNVKHFAPGIQGWIKAGEPVEAGK